MIAVAGSLNMDLVGRVPHLPALGETVLGSAFTRYHGGKGGNQAVAAARLGAAVRFYGALGHDGFGDELLHGLLGEGIDAGGVIRVDASSGCALVTVNDHGDNTICVLPGANLQAPLPPLPWPDGIEWLLLQLEVPMPTTLAWALAAHAAGSRVLLNAAPMTGLPPALLALVDTLVLNQVELEALVGSPASLHEGLVAAAALGPRQVVATLGGRGCIGWQAGQVYEVPAHAVWMVDSTGAGDTFTAALACGLCEARDWVDVLRRANVAAALSCTRAGARAGMPTRAELEQALAE